MTSSPPSSHLAAAVPPECTALPVCNWRQGLRSLWHLSRHLTARADDNHAAPSFAPSHRIKPHVPPLVRAPVNSFEFHRCRRTPQVDYLTPSLSHCALQRPTASNHRLRRGLPGYLIPFDPHAFAPQRRWRYGGLPSQSVFCVISMHFTATPHIPPAFAAPKPTSSDGTHGVGPRVFTAGLTGRLRAL